MLVRSDLTFLSTYKVLPGLCCHLTPMFTRIKVSSAPTNPTNRGSNWIGMWEYQILPMNSFSWDFMKDSFELVSFLIVFQGVNLCNLIWFVLWFALKSQVDHPDHYSWLFWLDSQKILSVDDERTQPLLLKGLSTNNPSNRRTRPY